MNGLPYYKRYPRDFIEGTIGLGFELKTAYAFLLDLIYMQGGKLPDEPRYISGLLECSVRKWKSIRQALIDAGHLIASEDGLTSGLVGDWKQESTRPAIPTDVINHVLSRDGQACVYCGASSRPFELDHVVPWSRGGQHTADNLVLACRPCNRSKGARTAEEWLS